jgi:hypothetical protein
MAVYSKKRDHGQEADAFVAVAVRVVFHESKGVRRSEHGQVGALEVLPLLLRPGQGRFENVLIPNSRQAAVLAELVIVNGVDDRPTQPPGLRTTLRHWLLGQLPEGVAVLLGGSGGDSQGTLDCGVVGSQQNSTVRFHRQDAITGLQSQAIGHILRQGGADRATGLAESHFFGHVSMVAH